MTTTPSVHLYESLSGFEGGVPGFVFGIPIETSISPIRGEMPALCRLTDGHLNEFHGRLLKVDSSSRRRRGTTGPYLGVVCAPSASVRQAAVCNYPAGRARIREPGCTRQLCHTSVPLLLFNLISPMRAPSGHFDGRAVVQHNWFFYVFCFLFYFSDASINMYLRARGRP